jgi:hypothetical protein
MRAHRKTTSPVSPAVIQHVSFWQFARAKRYHVITFRVLFQSALFLGMIYLAIRTGDYVHAHPLVTASSSLGLIRFLDRFEEVMTDCICDRIFPYSGVDIG